MLRSLIRSFALACSILTFALPQLALAQGTLDCSNEKELKSTPSSTPSEISFQNKSSEKRRIYWVDQEGDRKFYGVVEPGNVFKQQTRENHAWVVTDDAEKCLYAFVATAEPRVVDVGVADVSVPPPGGQQPIVQQAPVAPPPVVVQAPPPPVVQDPPPSAVQAAPPAPVVSAPATPVAVADDPAEVPEISPIEQFDLRGVFRISPRASTSMALNNEASGTVFVMNVKPEWDSGQWVFEAVKGAPFVRIKNQWKKTYLTDVGGKLRTTAATPDADEAHWTFEPVDGTSYVQFRNRETDRFLIAIGDAPALVDDLRPDQENLSQWKVAPAGRAVAAAPPPPPRNSAYEAALANCRELGGYWTGSSCRASINSKPLVCPRGYVWSEEAGECLWDGGGNCPPWQVGPGGACMTDLACRGGQVRMNRRGYPACYCPLGYVVWGDYPRLSCVPSVARIAPLLIGGVAIAVLGGNQGRPKIGEVFGNKNFCPQGQTGRPPNCVAATACPPPLVGTPPNCRRLVPKPILVNNPTCGPGQTGTPPNCVTPQTTTPTVVCIGGSITQNVCTCPSGTNRTPSGNGFQCVAQGGTTPPPQITCIGGTATQNSCTCPAGTDRTRLGNGFQCVAQAGTTPTTPTITCTGGTVSPQNVCVCPASMRLTGSGTSFACVAQSGTTNPIGTPASCGPNRVGTPPNCQCEPGRSGPNCAPDAPCDPRTQTGTPGNCVAKVIPCEGGTVDRGSGTCVCGSGKRVVNGVCSPITCSGGQMVGDQCRCNNQNQTPQRTSFSTFACVGGSTATCPSDSTGTPPSCTCKTGTTGQPGSCKPVQANAPNATPTNNPTATPRTCNAGERPQTAGCACASPMQVGANGVCAIPPNIRIAPAPPAKCPDGQVGTPPNCRAAPPAKCPDGQVGTPPNCTTPPPAKCPDGQVGTPPNCRAAAPAKCPDGQVGTPPNCRAAAPAKCLDGQVGTPPNCRAAAPAKCPDGQVGTPPNCRAAAPAKCPDGQVGTPPNCRAAAPAKCPDGQVGTPPNCRAAPPAKCPDGQVGTPPNCRAAAPAKCPDGQVGTPPNCVRAAPAQCPAGTVGTPPRCMAVQQNQGAPRVNAPPSPQMRCPPPKTLNPAGQCV